MNVRRVVMDVDKATQRPDLIELASAVDRVPGVEAVNITINEIDMETVDMDITVEGDDIDVRRLVGAIEETGAVVHSIDQVATGSRIIEGIRRSR
ncbi:DUF211 domain-containing protein [Streptosporangium saharense]|uniref:DUF211 domain-containing protein n=1 Tax=Streptosporangium saharense TaxID=1706840 RepID=A0A7W7VMB0_9ACTN|nr:DUF211 domain-containing protein [Streptosporangium saharense]MBB4915601.1 hypothetical protein [Streptosporangium saharense]